MELKLNSPYNLVELASHIEAEIPSEYAESAASILIQSLSTIENARTGCVTFLSNPLYQKYLGITKASAVIVSEDDLKNCTAAIPLVSKNSRLSLANILQLCDSSSKPKHEIHPSVVLGKNVKLGNNISIAPNCVIGDNVELGGNTILEPGVVIGSDCVIGASCLFKANVTIYHKVLIGNNCIIHSGTVIGSDGFGYAIDSAGSWVKMLHLGGVRLGNNIEIGSNTCIDRGMLEDTIISNNVIIDNLVQIGHNVEIGEGTAIAGCAGIAGSTVIGRYCLIGGAVSIAGHITIADKVHITGTSSVSNSLLNQGIYSSGFPAKENSAWRRNVARFMSLDSLAKRIKELEKSLDNL